MINKINKFGIIVFWFGLNINFIFLLFGNFGFIRYKKYNLKNVVLLLDIVIFFY